MSLRKKSKRCVCMNKDTMIFLMSEMKLEGIKPTRLVPLWDLGITLGFSTAVLGKKAAMLCTASVEEVIDKHYKKSDL